VVGRRAAASPPAHVVEPLARHAGQALEPAPERAELALRGDELVVAHQQHTTVRPGKRGAAVRVARHQQPVAHRVAGARDHARAEAGREREQAVLSGCQLRRGARQRDR
jgi:hypothetical protein